MSNLDNLFKLPVYEEPIYVVVAVSDKSDIEKEANSWHNSWLGLDLESLKSHWFRFRILKISCRPRLSAR